MIKKDRTEIEEEVVKRIAKHFNDGKNASTKFREEFKKQSALAITSAFAFLIALSWREPIQNVVNSLISKLGLVGNAIYIEFLSAIIITIIAVVALMYFSKWESKK